MAATYPEFDESVGPYPPLDQAPKVDPCDVPRLLSHYLRGVLHLVFEGGAEVRREVSQHDARGALAKQTGLSSSDKVNWATSRWSAWTNSRLLFSAFELAVDQQWPCSPSERTRLEASGHRHGIIHSLHEMWAADEHASEPSYSINAITALHEFACEGADRKTWDLCARQFEGDSGARIVSKFVADATEWNKSDSAEPHDDTQTTDDPPRGDKARDGRGPAEAEGAGEVEGAERETSEPAEGSD